MSWAKRGLPFPSIAQSGLLSRSTAQGRLLFPSSAQKGLLVPSPAQRRLLFPSPALRGLVSPCLTQRGPLFPSPAPRGLVSPCPTQRGLPFPSLGQGGLLFLSVALRARRLANAYPPSRSSLLHHCRLAAPLLTPSPPSVRWDHRGSTSLCLQPLSPGLRLGPSTKRLHPGS